MLAIRPHKSRQGNCAVNILPCRLNVAGTSVNATKKYWDPVKSKDGRNSAYFRGRKLHARSVQVPAGYRGVIVTTSEETLLRDSKSLSGRSKKDGLGQLLDETDDEVEEVDIGVMNEHADFGGVLVWAHGTVTDTVEDHYVRGMEEWVKLAQTIHGFEGEDKAKS